MAVGQEQHEHPMEIWEVEAAGVPTILFEKEDQTFFHQNLRLAALEIMVTNVQTHPQSSTINREISLTYSVVAVFYNIMVQAHVVSVNQSLLLT